MELAQAPNQTPNRRRNGPGGRPRNTPKQTRYASENDIPTYRPDHVGSPSTPNLDPSSVRPSSTNPKRRSGKKNNNTKKTPRNKDGVAPLDRNNSDRKSPSLQPKEAPMPIYAGSTFHASPAASALPIPMFLNKLTSDSSGTKAASSPEEGLSCPSTDSDEASSASPPSVPRTDESPLEFFFRADRAEKEARVRRASSVHTDAPALSPLSPFHEAHRSLKEYSPFPIASPPDRVRRPKNTSYSSTLISPEERGEVPGQPVGPAFSTPYQERMRAARSNQSSARSASKVLQSQDGISSDSLKRYLFTGRYAADNSQSQQSPTPPTPSNQGVQRRYEQNSPPAHRSMEQPEPTQNKLRQHHLPRGVFPAAVLTAHTQSSPSSIPPVQAQLSSFEPDQVSHMEDHLRRMLNIGSPGQSLSLQ
ncbi:hypothetical protein M426DRAFT_11055 [Hypoxylon sp. CI-4A]|nr:hypothetical protein M426DRAFT_11055 [Hypoxylon sp. CI-4A]